MQGYFKNDTVHSAGLLKENVPLSAKQDTWQVVDSPERLSKRFVFTERARLLDFINAVTAYEDSVSHHSMIRIDYLNVDVEVYTKDLNRITNLDREFAISVDEIFRDVRDYIYEKTNQPDFF